MVVVVLEVVGDRVTIGFTVGEAPGTSMPAGDSDADGYGPGVFVLSPDGGAVGVV